MAAPRLAAAAAARRAAAVTGPAAGCAAAPQAEGHVVFSGSSSSCTPRSRSAPSAGGQSRRASRSPGGDGGKDSPEASLRGPGDQATRASSPRRFHAAAAAPSAPGSGAGGGGALLGECAAAAGAEESEEEEEEAAWAAQVITVLSAEELEELKAAVPRNYSGKLTSLGSAGHVSGECMPCIFLTSGKGCPEGLLCGRCHFHHVRKWTDPQDVRLCKGKRNRYRKLMTKLMSQIDDDPDAFDASQVELPSFVTKSAMLRENFEAQLQYYATEVKRRSSGHRLLREGTPALSF